MDLTQVRMQIIILVMPNMQHCMSHFMTAKSDSKEIIIIIIIIIYFTQWCTSSKFVNKDFDAS